VIDAVSLYQLHRCVYDWVRAGEVGGGDAAAASGRESFDARPYELTDEERTA